MKIAFDIRSTLKKKTGIGYYTFNLINNLGRIDQVNQYNLYSQIGFFNKDKKLSALPGPNFKHAINRFKINTAKFLKGNEIIHTSSYDLGIPEKSKLVLIVHDVIHKAYPKGHGQDTIENIDSNLKKILPKAKFIIVDSKTSADDLARFYDVDKEIIKLIYPGTNEDILNENSENITSEYLENKYGVTMPFILYVGTLEPRKNVSGLLKAFAILKNEFKVKHRLVLCGMSGWGYEEIFSLVKELDLEKEIIFTGYVTRQELKAFYERAALFVYPSFYEGCGLPVLEAFSFGLPVVTSNVSSTAEIASDCAMLVNPESFPAISWAMLRIIKDDNLKTLLSQKGLARAKEFSWQVVAQKTLDIFNECVG